ncbi:MAG: DUF167 domain-containing protein [Pseudomonadales bacterium]|nr:DUF167 domain-containing protein [Pseudomonadales bacterium]MCP5186056.1 DUF167 domain-containing protein [Pseudomonadales bacterium]
MRNTNGTKLAVKVVPGAARSELAGWLGDVLRVRISAPAEKGKANAALIALLAQVLDVPPGSVSVLAGHGSPRKQVEIRLLSSDEVRTRLESALSSSQR